MVARQHFGNEPLRRPLDSAPAQRRDETGTNHARLTAAAGPDNGQEARHLPLFGQPADQPLDQGLAPEEVRGVGLVERLEAFIGVG